MVIEFMLFDVLVIRILLLFGFMLVCFSVSIDSIVV